MTTCAKTLNITGLSLALIGCALLFKFGLPPDFDPTGAIHLVGEQVDEAEVTKGKKYRFWGRVGFALIAIGTLFQMSAGWIS